MKISYKLFFRFILIICILLILYNNFSIQNYTEPKYKLVVVAIFKNEAVAMKEWLQHYVNQGVEHFYMINNGSTDNWEPEIEGFPVTIYTDNEPHRQVEHYNNYCLEKVKKNAKWVMIIDIDEFMYARNGFKTIQEYLDTLHGNIGQIKVKFKMFGSNGHKKQPKSIVKGFTRRKLSNHKGPDKLNNTKDCEQINNQVKSIVRVSKLNKFNIHEHDLKLLSTTLTLPETTLELDLNKQPLHLNHYWTQSWEWFKDIKMTRGDVKDKTRDTTRYKKDTFDARDWNDIVDTELSNMTP